MWRAVNLSFDHLWVASAPDHPNTRDVKPLGVVNSDLTLDSMLPKEITIQKFYYWCLHFFTNFKLFLMCIHNSSYYFRKLGMFYYTILKHSLKIVRPHLQYCLELFENFIKICITVAKFALCINYSSFLLFGEQTT